MIRITIQQETPYDRSGVPVDEMKQRQEVDAAFSMERALRKCIEDGLFGGDKFVTEVALQCVSNSVSNTTCTSLRADASAACRGMRKEVVTA